MEKKTNQEIEVRFLHIDVEDLKQKLTKLNAKDEGEDFLEETIYYDQELTWHTNGRKIVRVRRSNRGVVVAYKHQAEDTIDSTEEIEFKVDDAKIIDQFLDRVGLVAYRQQQKKRHTFTLPGVTIDIDTWPKVPTYVEIEGISEELVRQTATDLELDWNQAIFEPVGPLLERVYGLPVRTLRYFTFDRVE